MQKDFITVTPDSGTGDATVTVDASKNTGKERTSSIVISGGGIERTIQINQQEVERFTPASTPDGVFILSSDGFVYERSVWDTANNDKAIGVVVKTPNCAFVIAPDEQTSIRWGGYDTLISDCTTTTSESTAKTDFDGFSNTEAIYEQINETEEQYAAKYCRNYVFKTGRTGYLPALGEWLEAYQNKSEVDACMSLIGGKALYDSSLLNIRKWSSTQFNNKNAWFLDCVNSKLVNIEKSTSYTYCARPFAQLSAWY